MSYLLRFHLLTSVMLASAGALGIALIAQYGYQLNPCELCSYQRIPYGGIILFGGLALAFGGWNRAAVGYLFGVIFLVGAALAFYHTGVEQHWWIGPEGCTGPGGTPQTLDALRAQIAATPVIRCDDIAFSLFGISMAGYNVLFSLALAIYAALVSKAALRV